MIVPLKKARYFFGVLKSFSSSRLFSGSTNMASVSSPGITVSFQVVK